MNGSFSKNELFFLYSHTVKRTILFILIVICCKPAFAQKDSTFNPKAEVAYDGKRYRVYNNWLSVGGGAGYNSRWPKDEKNAAVDFSFHVKKIISV